MSPSFPIINESSPFSVTKSATKDPTQGTGTTTTTKKKKYTVLAAILSCVGLTGFSIAQYTSSSGGRGDTGGGIRASVDTVDGLLLSSSVDLRSGSMGDGKCVPASGKWGGKSFSGHGSTPFETCYKYAPTGDECWSKSFYIGPAGWYECPPNGYTRIEGQGWNFLNSGAATPGCGSPCQQYDDYGAEPSVDDFF
mmetsp:Transcript_47461/g.53084  ORF Transcript_47461/g.53084 Transcript_47461/m.53084 type:complete len:195 (-) Transcript_47461:80-664(-)